MATATDAGVTDDARAAAAMLGLGSDPTRVGILWRLAAGPMSVGEMTAEFGVSQPSISHHMQICRCAGLVESSKEGKRIVYRLTDRGLALAGAARAVLAMRA